MSQSRSVTPITGHIKLPPISSNLSDINFLKTIEAFIETEFSKIYKSNVAVQEEQRYLIYKAVFHKVLEHAKAYENLLTTIKKQYEETISSMKKGATEAVFLQEKLKEKASEPTTLRNYRKRTDELEERLMLLRKENSTLKDQIKGVENSRLEYFKKFKPPEIERKQPKKDKRLIPGLSLEKHTDVTVLQETSDSLERQLRELNISIRTRFLPRTHKTELKETLDNKVIYRDQLLSQSQMYKARSQRMKIALEAAQAYNQMKPPHQTVGDAVTLAFQLASGRLLAEKEKVEGEPSESTSNSLEDDDPNKEKEAEIMLEYIEKFNELFEDGLYEQAAAHAANSPKGILRTQATLAKFKEVEAGRKAPSPLLAFCDALMASVGAAGRKPNEALSRDCVEAALNEKKLDLVSHWLAQERLTISLELGYMLSTHCVCPVPCLCGCQALAQNVFSLLKESYQTVLALLKQGKRQGALEVARSQKCIEDKNLPELLRISSCHDFISGLFITDSSGKKTILNVSLYACLKTLVYQDKLKEANLLIHELKSPSDSSVLSLKDAVVAEQIALEEMKYLLESLSLAGYTDTCIQLLAMHIATEVISQAKSLVQDEKRAVSFSNEILVKETTNVDSETDRHGIDDEVESSSGMSTFRSLGDSVDDSSRETTPDVKQQKKKPRSILKSRKKSNIKIRTRIQEVENIPADTECDDVNKKRSRFLPGGIPFIDSDPYTSNPESAADSEAE